MEGPDKLTIARKMYIGGIHRETTHQASSPLPCHKLAITEEFFQRMLSVQENYTQRHLPDETFLCH